MIIASYGTFSTGINIRNINNIVFSSPSKSKIRVLQSLGRGLRQQGGDKTLRLYDISDDLSLDSKLNFTLRHFKERINIYNDQKFDYEIRNNKMNLNRIQNATLCHSYRAFRNLEIQFLEIF